MPLIIMFLFTQEVPQIQAMRSYERKTNRGMVPADSMRHAIYQVTMGGKKIASVARDMHIPRVTLMRYVHKSEAGHPLEYEGQFTTDKSSPQTKKMSCVNM